MKTKMTTHGSIDFGLVDFSKFLSLPYRFITRHYLCKKCCGDTVIEITHSYYVKLPKCCWCQKKLVYVDTVRIVGRNDWSDIKPTDKKWYVLDNPTSQEKLEAFLTLPKKES